MGLDFVELVMELEEQFQLRIPDGDVESMRTVGDVIDYVWSRLSTVSGEPCPTRNTFVAFQRTLADVAGLQARDIRPSSSLDKLLGQPKLKRRWRSLTRDFPQLPDLEPPAWMLRLYMRAVAGGVLCGAAGGVLVCWGSGVLVAGMALWIGGAAGGMVTHAFVSPWLEDRRREVPSGCRSVRDAVMMVHAGMDGTTTRAVVELRVRLIVADLFGAKLDDVHPESRFVEDLGAG